MAAFIMAGPLQALGFVLLFALLSMFMPLTGLLGNAAIGLVTLRLGWRRGLSIAIAASVIMSIATLFIHGRWLVGLGSGLLEWIPVILLATLLTRTSSWKHILQTVFGLAALGVALFHLNVADPSAFWKEVLGALINLEMVQEQFAELDLKDLLDKAAAYMTGVFAAGAGIALTLSLMIARHWQAMLYNPGGFQQEIRDLRLDKLSALVIAAAIMLTLLGGSSSPWSMDLVMVGLGLFLFQGIALVHGVRAILKVHQGWLFALYIPLVLMPVQMGILLSAFGIIDTMADFRGHLQRKPPA